MNDTVKINEVAGIQKDVFATVFFISDAVGKIGLGLAGKIIPQNNTGRTDNPQPKQPAANTSNDGIFQPHFDKDFKVLKSYVSDYRFDCVPNSVSLQFYDKHRTCFLSLFYLMIMLLFFISVKNAYDSVYNKIIGNIFKTRLI